MPGRVPDPPAQRAARRAHRCLPLRPFRIRRPGPGSRRPSGGPAAGRPEPTTSANAGTTATAARSSASSPHPQEPDVKPVDRHRVPPPPGSGCSGAFARRLPQAPSPRAPACPAGRGTGPAPACLRDLGSRTPRRCISMHTVRHDPEDLLEAETHARPRTVREPSQSRPRVDRPRRAHAPRSPADRPPTDRTHPRVAVGVRRRAGQLPEDSGPPALPGIVLREAEGRLFASLEGTVHCDQNRPRSPHPHPLRTPGPPGGPHPSPRPSELPRTRQRPRLSRGPARREAHRGDESRSPASPSGHRRRKTDLDGSFRSRRSIRGDVHSGWVPAPTRTERWRGRVRATPGPYTALCTLTSGCPGPWLLFPHLLEKYWCPRHVCTRAESHCCASTVWNRSAGYVATAA
jgi:hypothetical protein